MLKVCIFTSFIKFEDTNITRKCLGNIYEQDLYRCLQIKVHKLLHLLGKEAPWKLYLSTFIS